MSGVSRRGFVKGVTAALPVLALPGVARAESVRSVAAIVLPPLAETVLPSELGPSGFAAAAAGFLAWVDGFEPIAERDHGYGTGELDFLPPDPWPGWNEQLRALEIEAHRRHGQSFVSLDLEARRRMIAQHIAVERGDRLPAPLEARHVALALLSWWCATPAAADLCHRAQIGRRSCRPLDSSPDRPAPLGG